jgi:hypothetical protein
MTYKVIRFSNEHIHVVTREGRGKEAELHVQCYLSRNWNRCTAGDLDPTDWPSIAASQDRSYYDGNAWTRAPRP